MEQHRLESFTTNWPFNNSDSCNVQNMAEAGFYFCGNDRENDTAACFVCGKVLDGWESTDVPIDEHRKHAPQCLFVKLGKTEKDFLRNLIY
uniref:Uncharacterized protein n=1 Tax=Megaselia scalaris TaxID=36166 RepID=T1GWH2_MEGSC